jgi:hypothetical protein
MNLVRKRRWQRSESDLDNFKTTAKTAKYAEYRLKQRSDCGAEVKM